MFSEGSDSGLELETLITTLEDLEKETRRPEWETLNQCLVDAVLAAQLTAANSAEAEHSSDRFDNLNSPPAKQTFPPKG
jgi:hypothetical protein